MGFCENESQSSQSLYPINVIHNLWKHWHVLVGINYSKTVIGKAAPWFLTSHRLQKTQNDIFCWHSSTARLTQSTSRRELKWEILQRKIRKKKVIYSRTFCTFHALLSSTGTGKIWEDCKKRTCNDGQRNMLLMDSSITTSFSMLEGL